MTGPATPPVQEHEEIVPGELTLEQVERMSAAPADLSKVEISDAALGTFKGKTAAELLEHAKRLESSLQASERARLQAEQIAQLAARSAPAAPVVPPVQEPSLPTDEEIAKIYDENPMQAIKMMTDRAQKLAEQSFQARMGPLVQSTSSAAEQAARARYPEEFEVFKDDITEAVKMIPNAKAALANPEAWDDLIAWVRGRRGNFEKLYEHRQVKERTVAAAAAQTRQVESIGFNPSPTSRAPIFRADGSPDPIAKEIAEKLDMPWDEYVKWSKV